MRERKARATSEWVFGAKLDDVFIFKALQHETGDPCLRPYSCRHTLATRLVARGFTLEQVARVLRNSVAVCERHYVAGTRVHDAFDIATGARVQVS